MSASEDVVTSVAALEALYDAPIWASLAKETETLIAPYQAFIRAAPYLTFGSVGAPGVDCSPRGDFPGFVRIVDDTTVMIPNRNGNNRIDSLRNIVRDPRVAIHFLVPGCGESLRIKGRATVSADAALTASFAVENNIPRTVIIVVVESVYFHSAKAIHRSKLWDVSSHVARGALPSPNAILAAIQWQRCRQAVGLGRRV